jgi:hypothetical protein
MMTAQFIKIQWPFANPGFHATAQQQTEVNSPDRRREAVPYTARLGDSANSSDQLALQT